MRVRGWWNLEGTISKMGKKRSATGADEIKKRTAVEVRKLVKLLKCSGVPENKIRCLEPTVQNLAWMKVKLDDARELIGTESITVGYDNGGGQSGIRENPAYKAYEALWKNYSAGLNALLGQLPDKAAPGILAADVKPVNALMIVQQNRERGA